MERFFAVLLSAGDVSGASVEINATLKTAPDREKRTVGLLPM
nr:hypothetical 4.3K protein - Agrobacterium rhizogenes plasmid pRiA4b [Rhizobium rhizogenes]